MRTLKEYQRRESKANGDTYNGLEYDSEVVSADGVKITLFTPKGTTGEVMRAAMAEAKSKRVVVGFRLEVPPTCEHESREDHMNCMFCGQCREDLDSNDLCMDCGGVDENETDDEPWLGTCETENCDWDVFEAVPNASGDDLNLCSSCYDAYIIGLNRGMGMIVELPEAMKRARLADALREIRHSPNFDHLMSSEPDVIEAFATGMCQSLNTDLRTTTQFKRILHNKQ